MITHKTIAEGLQALQNRVRYLRSCATEADLQNEKDQQTIYNMEADKLEEIYKIFYGE